MSSEIFVSDLNANNNIWKIVAGNNNGYPIFYWQ